jgi:hypothetical protein
MQLAGSGLPGGKVRKLPTRVEVAPAYAARSSMRLFKGCIDVDHLVR